VLEREADVRHRDRLKPGACRRRRLAERRGGGAGGVDEAGVQPAKACFGDRRHELGSIGEVTVWCRLADAGGAGDRAQR
jgi:hypothetical protein